MMESRARWKATFADAPDFLPTLTPAECIRKGILVDATSIQRAASRGSSGVRSMSRTRSFLLRGLRTCPDCIYRDGTMSPPIATRSKAALGNANGNRRGGFTFRYHALASHSLHFALMSSFFIHTHRFDSLLTTSSLVWLSCFVFDRIRVDGFNGTAASSAAAARTTTNDRSSVGPPAPRCVEGGGISYVVQLPRLQSMLMMLQLAQ